MPEAKFKLGTVVSTPTAIAVLKRHGVTIDSLISRHVTADWGDTCDEDAEMNNAALTNGNRIMSVYELNHQDTIWLITEADRTSTCLLTPQDY